MYNCELVKVEAENRFFVCIKDNYKKAGSNALSVLECDSLYRDFEKLDMFLPALTYLTLTFTCKTNVERKDFSGNVLANVWTSI